MSEVAIGICGGVAAYKVAAVVSRLAQSGRGVSVVVTSSATQFIGSASLAALSGRPVYSQLFDSTEFPLGPHIGLADRADLLCIAPATANFLAKAATGAADDLLSTLYLAFDGPVLCVPAMNARMWEQPAVQRNVQQLKADGVSFVGPDEGWLSCRVQGAGRMSEPEEIVAAIESTLASREDG